MIVVRIYFAGLKSTQVRAVALGQAGRGRAFEDKIFDAVLLAILALAAFVAVFVHGVDVGLEPFDFRVGIQQPVPVEMSACFTNLIEPQM